MTEQERLLAFNEELKALCNKYGVALRSVMIAEQYGEMVQLKPSNDIRAEAIANWQPPAPDPQQPKVKVDTSLMEKEYLAIVQSNSGQ